MPPNSFTQDLERSRRFVPAFKRVMADHLIDEAPFEEDTQRATDLIVLKLEAIRVGCRVRRHQYVDRYGDEFTIRTDRPNGIETELGKVLQGFGDYLLYGFADEGDGELCAWLLGDLSVFRLWFQRQSVRLDRGVLPGVERPNRDGSSTFRAFRVNDLPPEFIRARQPFVRHDEATRIAREVFTA